MRPHLREWAKFTKNDTEHNQSQQLTKSIKSICGSINLFQLLAGWLAGWCVCVLLLCCEKLWSKYGHRSFSFTIHSFTLHTDTHGERKFTTFRTRFQFQLARWTFCNDVQCTCIVRQFDSKFYYTLFNVRSSERNFFVRPYIHRMLICLLHVYTVCVCLCVQLVWEFDRWSAHVCVSLLSIPVYAVQYRDVRRRMNGAFTITIRFCSFRRGNYIWQNQPNRGFLIWIDGRAVLLGDFTSILKMVWDGSHLFEQKFKCSFS